MDLKGQRRVTEALENLPNHRSAEVRPAEGEFIEYGPLPRTYTIGQARAQVTQTLDRSKFVDIISNGSTNEIFTALDNAGMLVTGDVKRRHLIAEVPQLQFIGQCSSGSQLEISFIDVTEQ